MKFAKDTSTNLSNMDKLPGRMRQSFPSIRDELFWSLYAKASPFSMVHITGFYNVFQSMNYIHRNQIPGDIAECGCFLGGVGIFMTLLRNHLGMQKKVYLFDSFEGFPLGEQDVSHGVVAKAYKFVNILEDVKENFRGSMPEVRDVEFIEGFVESTLPKHTVGGLCLLRLDTDFYNSTKAELEYLYPTLVRGGVLIVDDYGWFDGARRATDEFLAAATYPPLLNRIDEGIWAGVKP
jgi:hypothetical protein